MISDVYLILLQILGVAKQPGSVTCQQHKVNCQLVVVAVTVHADILASWNADIWWKVKL